MDGLIQFSTQVRFLKMTTPIGCLSEKVWPRSINQSSFISATQVYQHRVKKFWILYSDFFLLRFSFFHLILKFLVKLAQLCFNLHLVFQLLLLLHLLVILFPKPSFVHLALEFHFIQVFPILTLIKFWLCDFFEMVWRPHMHHLIILLKVPLY